MPADARMSRPRGSGLVRLHRSYFDPLGRSMLGTVDITGSARTEDAGRVGLPVTVTVELADGVLDVALPPDVYSLRARLRTVDDHDIRDLEEVDLTA